MFNINKCQVLIFIILLNYKAFLVVPAGVGGSQLATLKGIQIVGRHGDRIPGNKKSASGDKFGEAVEPLLNSGKREMYDLGVFLRERYPGFLSQNYDPSEISFITSDSDRTIQSALALGRGLYKEFNGLSAWSKELQPRVMFEPIAVRQIPKELDKYLQLTHPCPRYDQLIEAELTRYLDDFCLNYPDSVSIYRKETQDQVVCDGSKGAVARTILISNFCDVAFFNSTHNLPLTPAATELMSRDEFSNFTLYWMMNTFILPEQQRLYYGSLIELLISNFKASNSPEFKKMHIFTGHDRNVLGLMYTFNVTDPFSFPIPPTSAALIIELHEGIDKEPYLEFWYRNGSTVISPHQFKPPNCGQPCYLKTFQSLHEHLIPGDFESECQAVE